MANTETKFDVILHQKITKANKATLTDYARHRGMTYSEALRNILNIIETNPKVKEYFYGSQSIT